MTAIIDSEWGIVPVLVVLVLLALLVTLTGTASSALMVVYSPLGSRATTARLQPKAFT
ncbi:MAG: hypothetical protein ACRD6W_02560 [Nitrososphaerales archaeon]